MTSERERLKPCPFCGSPAALDSQFGREWWVQCLGCDASHGVLDESPGDAENRWNTRAALPAPADQPTSQEARELTDEQILDVPAGINNGSQAFLLRFARAVIDADRKARQQEALDARRLDHLIKCCTTAGVGTEMNPGFIKIEFIAWFPGREWIGELPTVRAAIDAAIAKGEHHE